MSHPWMPLYVADYLADTRRLSTLEHGAYLLLIMDYWRNGSLPDDEEMLARIAGLTTREWARCRPSIAPLFHDGWKHNRIDRELAESASRSESARRSAAERWKGRRNLTASAKAERLDMRTHCEGSAEPMLSQSQPQSQKESSLRSDSAPKPKRTTRLAIDFIPTPAMRQVGREHGLTEREIDLEGEKMRDWSLSAKGGAKLDWDATWRNWLKNRTPSPRAGPNGVSHSASLPNPEKSVHAAAKKLCDDVATGAVTFGPIAPSVGTLFTRDRERKREDSPRLLSEG